MAMQAKMSLLGLLNWDEDLFENFAWPEAFLPHTVDNVEIPPAMDKLAFLAELSSRTAELEILYPRPDVFKAILNQWSITRKRIWDHLWNTTQYEYNPIENYNRTETGEDADTHSGTDSSGNTQKHTGSDTVTSTPGDESYIAAFDSVASGDDDGLVKQARAGGESTNETEYDSTVTDQGAVVYGHKIENEHHLNVHGNIGVMSTQDMIKQEREIAMFNLYDVMIQDFKDRFCILVY